MKMIMTGVVLLVGTFALAAEPDRAAYNDAGAEESEAIARHSSLTYEVTFTNITHGVILTPPILSLSRRQIDVFELGAPASLGLEMLAEGGATDELKAEWEMYGLQDVVQTMDAVPPGQSITVELEGDRRSRLNLASMVLPTNDGFVAMNGPRVWQVFRSSTFYLNAYDAGTEENDELCASIPGPQCGGEGFNEEAGEGFVAPHAGLHGEGELSRQAYGWGDPVAKVTIRVVY
jgi:hypothetical protein